MGRTRSWGRLGIYACAQEVEKVGDDEYVVKFSEGESVLEGLDGVLNGGHTATIIWDNRGAACGRKCRTATMSSSLCASMCDRDTRRPPPRQKWLGTLNTTLQVQDFLLAEHQDRFEWIHDSIAGKPYEQETAFKENVNAPFYVTDVLSMLDLFNMVDYPNDGGSHPTGAYREKVRY